MKLSFLRNAILVSSVSGLVLPSASVAATDPMIDRIASEGMDQSQVMLLAHELIDGIGARLTNSPSINQAQDWAMAKYRGWGLKNVHEEPFLFGPGWSFREATARMVIPRVRNLTVIPIAWTPGTPQPISAEVVVAPIEKPEHFDKWRGKLAGKIVLIDLPGNGDEPTEAAFVRLDDKALADLDTYDQPNFDPDDEDRRTRRITRALQVAQFLKDEGALAFVRRSPRDGGLVHGSGYTHWPDQYSALPGFELAAEDYRRLARFETLGQAPTLQLYSDARFEDADMTADNVFAEIPGTDPNAGYVMAGAHFDSWVAGDGAVDNGAGSAAVMEAARILSTLGIRPKRTIRFALWSGEEQGLLGSQAFIRAHIADRPAASDPLEDTANWQRRFPITKKAEYDRLKAYFNIDNGSGKLRGIYAEGNLAAAPLLGEWMQPFAPLGATKVVTAKTGGTDHVFMQSVAAPAYQFIQDPLDYDSRLHHTSVDTLDHMRPDDMRQMSVILAGMLYQAAMDERELPRRPLPTQPTAADPFKVKDPDAE